MSNWANIRKNEKWREDLKEFLSERSRAPSKSEQTVNQLKYVAFDIEEDLKKKIKKESIRPLEGDKTEQKEVAKMDQSLGSPSSFNASWDENSFLQDISNESFEAMEKMCNKTASDPNSTLFEYLNSDEKEQVIARIKNRTTVTNEPDKQQQIEAGDELLQSGRTSMFDETQLDDIEAPSKLWENTVLHTSPVKMVGLLRPSTIIEELGEESNSDDGSSQTSYQTAQSKESLNDVYFNCSDTATDLVSVDENVNLHDSMDLIVFEKTLTPVKKDYATLSDIECSKFSVPKQCLTLNESPADINADVSTDSVILVSSDEEDEDEKQIFSTVTKTTIKNEKLSTVGIDIEEEEEEKENRDEYNTSNEIEFNDTMEEVDYLLRKGMEYMESATTTNSVKTVELLLPATTNMNSKGVLQKPDTFLKTPTKTANSGLINSPAYTSTCSPGRILNMSPLGAHKTVLTNSNTQSKNRFAINIKPFPKLDLFTTPSSLNAGKSATTRQKDNFKHVVSPISAYVNKTAVSPLVTTIKSKSNYADLLNSTAIKTLQEESRLNRPQQVDHLRDFEFTYKPCSLPKKAYISSDYQQYTDKRTPITIPGGKSIQQYLDTVTLPAVLCHEGKLKSSSDDTTTHTTHQNLCTTNDTLADLSVMAGDVSMYTIKDAQKF